MTRFISLFLITSMVGHAATDTDLRDTKVLSPRKINLLESRNCDPEVATIMARLKKDNPKELEIRKTVSTLSKEAVCELLKAVAEELETNITLTRLKFFYGPFDLNNECIVCEMSGNEFYSPKEIYDSRSKDESCKSIIDSLVRNRRINNMLEVEYRMVRGG
ncbi:MAG: hypothetical protein NTX76_06385 [Alphaproteobacteria bacterium]|nr:hypothetical protein [Alphaproteobacteria bacterium]